MNTKPPAQLAAELLKSDAWKHFLLPAIERGIKACETALLNCVLTTDAAAASRETRAALLTLRDLPKNTAGAATPADHQE